MAERARNVAERRLARRIYIARRLPIRIRLELSGSRRERGGSGSCQTGTANSRAALAMQPKNRRERLVAIN